MLDYIYVTFALLEIGELVTSASIGLVGLGPASRVFTFHVKFHLLDSLLTTTTNISICPHMTSYSNTLWAQSAQLLLPNRSA